MHGKILLLLGVLVATVLSGCLSDDGPGTGTTQTNLTDVFERAQMPFNTTSNVHSWTLEAGAYGILPGVQSFVSVPLPPTEGAPSATGMADMSIGIFFPDIPGCDWSASALPEECHVPVISDIGPYYASSTGRDELNSGDFVVGEGDNPVTSYSCGRLMCTLVDNFVPHGYAVAAVSVFGTGDSGSCQDLMGTAEQAGVQAAVEYLGEAAWSNGNVAIIGRSYDGSTPWEAAAGGSEHLKTIVPISGLTNGQYDLMWRNGSAEYRAPGVLYGLYAAMTIDGEADDATQVVCPDYLLGGPEASITYAAGGPVADPAYDYWAERAFFERVLANYQGSVYFVHGMQDWNVDNHQAFPYYNQLRDAGFEVKGLFGQWDHAYPDRASERGRLPSGYGLEANGHNVRYDWAQDLLEWFDHYLKGTGDQPDLHTEIEDNWGQWRIESDYPPRDAEHVDLVLGDADALHTTPDVLVGTCDPTQIAIEDCDSTSVHLQYVFPALSEDNDTRIAGNVAFQPTVTPTGPGGQIGATLYDATTGLRLGHAIMDLRFHQGGSDLQPVVPGMAIVPQMQFLAMDVVLPAGHGLRLDLTPTVMDYLPSTVTDPILVDAAQSHLYVPVVERDDDVFFDTPQPSTDA